jgi:antitoxin component of MazEF toxin-antitoxin module
MTKSLTKVGNSVGIVFDRAFLDSGRLKVGDQFTVTIHNGGSIVLTPANPRPLIEPKKAAATAKRLIKKNSELFRRLS